MRGKRGFDYFPGSSDRAQIRYTTGLGNSDHGSNPLPAIPMRTSKKAYARAVELLSLVGINEPGERMKQYPHELNGVWQTACHGSQLRWHVHRSSPHCHGSLLPPLDVTIQAQILELMMELEGQAGHGALTHDLGIAASTCDRIAVMYADFIVGTYEWGLV